ncbi:uncharacterized protein L3040_001000 [Drepanopeziza brunnea f. sp. 'multigermtubi']|uniref:uncharacterized protein n=1 Tax=Drepanopeziza brunnea f. sp. 'multigermtubi' TaxID=698441 RepID=UPI0023A085AC|nr:hypothetical protein L3040_001000 [Drepanopeziza brunnea f. sp. 'multigermtubi']
MQLTIAFLSLLAFGSNAAEELTRELFCDHGTSNPGSSCPSGKNMYCCLPVGIGATPLDVPRGRCEAVIGIDFLCGQDLGFDPPFDSRGKCCP